MSFFWRIFLSAWAILVATIVLTLWAGNWLSDASQSPRATRYGEQMVEVVARDLRNRLAQDARTAANATANAYELNFEPILQIYIIDAAGEDVMGRTLPSRVQEAFNAARRGSAVDVPDSARLHVRSDQLGGYVVIGEDTFVRIREVMMRPGGRRLFIVLMLILSSLASLMLARFIVLPVRRLQLAGQRVAGGDTSVRVAHTVGGRTDDIARLAQDFDVMTQRVDALLGSQKRLMRDVSHELRSPLARLQALLSISRQGATDSGIDQIDRMERELNRLDSLIGEILSYARLEARSDVRRQATDVVDLVRNIVDDASLESSAKGARIEFHGPDRCVVQLDSALMQSAVENVVRNAIKHTGDGTTVRVEVSETTAGVRVTVEDRGPGVPEDALDQIFEPFYRVENARRTRTGTGGIGLAIARRSARLHGGTVTASNRSDGGLRVAFDVPTLAIDGG